MYGSLGPYLTEVNLAQSDADALLAMEKHRIDEAVHAYPAAGGILTIGLQSSDKRERFTLDVWRSQFVLSKGTYQNRAKGFVILVRLDFHGAPHRNPDDQEIPCPHLHAYREGYGDKWAYPLSPDDFSDPDDLWQLLQDFMRYINVTRPPDIQRGLFV